MSDSTLRKREKQSPWKISVPSLLPVCSMHRCTYLHLAERLRLVAASRVRQPDGEFALHSDEIHEGHIRHVHILSGPVSEG